MLTLHQACLSVSVSLQQKIALALRHVASVLCACRLIAVVGHVCASSLWSALQQSGSTSDSQSGQSQHAWSSQQAAETFDAVLWSLAAAQAAAVQQPAADNHAGQSVCCTIL